MKKPLLRLVSEGVGDRALAKSLPGYYPSKQGRIRRGAGVSNLLRAEAAWFSMGRLVGELLIRSYAT
jgi:hypothetical protein